MVDGLEMGRGPGVDLLGPGHQLLAERLQRGPFVVERAQVGLGPVVELPGPRGQLRRQPLQPRPVVLEGPGVGRRPLVDLAGPGGQVGRHPLQPGPLGFERAGDLRPPRPSISGRRVSTERRRGRDGPVTARRRGCGAAAATAWGGGRLAGAERGPRRRPAGSGEAGAGGHGATAGAARRAAGAGAAGWQRRCRWGPARSSDRLEPRCRGGRGRAVRARRLAGAAVRLSVPAPMDDGVRRAGFGHPLRRGHRGRGRAVAGPDLGATGVLAAAHDAAPGAGAGRRPGPHRMVAAGLDDHAEFGASAHVTRYRPLHTRAGPSGFGPVEAPPDGPRPAGQFAVSGACPVDCALFHKGMSVGLQARAG